MKTAIDILIEEYEKMREDGNTDMRTVIHKAIQAKEMEAEQIEEAYKCGWDAGDFGSDCWEEIYYKQTYGGKK